MIYFFVKIFKIKKFFNGIILNYSDPLYLFLLHFEATGLTSTNYRVFFLSFS